MNRYKVILDSNGYITGAYLTTGDDYDLEGNLADWPDIAKGWYKIKDGALDLDENKKAEIIKAINDALLIAELKEQLQGTDEDILAMLEDIGSLTNPLTFVADLIALVKKYATLIAERKNIREQIKELED